ncbi:MAG: hypothetical protein ACTHJM_05315 [Marmoricola sp.]
MSATALDVGHDHVWRIAEVEFVDNHSLNRYECSCGATTFVFSG